MASVGRGTHWEEKQQQSLRHRNARIETMLDFVRNSSVMMFGTTRSVSDADQRRKVDNVMI